ncbi:hypothetical protein CPB86DRAFT_178349 [Serendipita vermifera]|nr:hypothetical protein CPB86DRAFT_178349 [Serendipita vermifera]
MIIDLCQVTQKVKKPIKLQIISLLEMLVEENDIRGHFTADEAVGATLCLIEDEERDIRRVAILYATRLSRDEVVRGKIWVVGLATSIIDKLSDDNEGGNSGPSSRLMRPSLLL